MPIIAIGQFEGIDERFVAAHQAVANSTQHQLPRPAQRDRIEIWPV
jgi:hypothetical protein